MTATDRMRFAFGKNWGSFVEIVDEDRVRAAEASLVAKLGADALLGRSFLDIGCGSGLFSLAAARLGASRIHSFDYDDQSVEATLALRTRGGEAKVDWTVERGDVTDAAYCERLGTFSVVFAWGVLHHTGAMWQAMENAVGRVGKDGLFFVAIYNDQGWKSRLWRAVKRLYNRLPEPARPLYAAAVWLPFEARAVVRSIVRRDLGRYVREWTHGYHRGMSRRHDIVDWVGGYPFEVATPDEVFDFCLARGLQLTSLTTARGGSGNNEFVFRRGG